MRRTALFDVLSVKIHAGVSAVGDWKNQKKVVNMRTWGCIFRVYGEKKPLNGLCQIFFLMKDIHDVITHAKFGDDRLRGLGVVAGQISAFPIDFAGRPYNTLTLP